MRSSNCSKVVLLQLHCASLLKLLNPLQLLKHKLHFGGRGTLCRNLCRVAWKVMNACFRRALEMSS